MTGRRMSLALLAGLSLALSLVLARAIPLLDPDEGRNAEVAREMAASGDVVIPTLAGMPYLDKPPALFWCAALAIRVLGRTATAVRLPAALAAIATVVLLFRCAQRRAGPDAAWRACALLITAPLFAVLSAYVIFDMPLTLCVTAVWTGIVDDDLDDARIPRRLAMFAALGIGLLLKGPVMLAWAVGGSAGGALLTRSRAPLRWLAFAPGWALALGMAGGWFALACARHPEYPRYAFLEESLERMSSGSFHRDQPVWFVPAVLLGGTLPWSFTTPWTRQLSRASRVALGFVAFAAVFFTLSRSKLVTYLLPALPPLAWIAAEAWGRGTRSPRLFAAGLALTPLVLLAGLPALAHYAAGESGAPLAAAIEAARPGATVRYEYCYSPGTDFLRGRSSVLVSPVGHETTSNYQVRYRERLIARGRWRALAEPPASRPDVIVRPARDTHPLPANALRFFADHRFVAYRMADTTGTHGR